MGSKASLALSLLLHELTTNALKYGSLSLGAGRVDLTWWVEGNASEEMLQISWRESKGPKIAAPATVGFGSRLINAGLVGSGAVAVTYDSTGLICKISASIAELQNES